MPVKELGPHFEFASWRVPEFQRSIEYPLEVMEEIRAFACDELLQLSHGGDEVGGILFGTRREDLIRILTWRPIACEHSQGQALRLSHKDRLNLAVQLEVARQNADLRDLRPVGWFVSHLREGVALLASDLEIYNGFFPESWQVALVICPRSGGRAQAGFFARETGGKVQSEASYQSFDLAPLHSPAAAVKFASTPRPEAAPPEPPPVARPKEPEQPESTDLPQPEPVAEPKERDRPEFADLLLPAPVAKPNEPERPEFADLLLPAPVAKPKEPEQSEFADLLLPAPVATPKEPEQSELADLLLPAPVAKPNEPEQPELADLLLPAPVAKPKEPEQPELADLLQPAPVATPNEPKQPESSHLPQRPPQDLLAPPPLQTPVFQARTFPDSVLKAKPMRAKAFEPPVAEPPAFQAPALHTPSFQVEEPLPSRERWFWAVPILLALGIAAFMLYQRQLPSSNASIALRASSEAQTVQLAWDANSRAIRDAFRGEIEINDGGKNSQISLTSDQLHAGKLSYVPQSGDVGFVMTVYPPNGDPIHDSTRLISPVLNQPTQPPQLIPATPAPETPPAPAPPAADQSALQQQVQRLRDELGKERARADELQNLVRILENRLGIKGEPPKSPPRR